MKFVTHETLLAMPAGTVYATYEPCIFGELRIKEDVVGSSTWYYQDMIPWFEGTKDSGAWIDTLDAIKRGEGHPPLDYDFVTKQDISEATGYMAFERADLESLVSRFQRALIEGYAQ